MKKGIDRFCTAWSLLSRIPLGFRFEPQWDLLAPQFLIIGIILAALICAAGTLLTSALTLIRVSYVVPALFILFLQYIFFNIFHFDGLVDSADALLPLATPEKRLDILKDRYHGSYALFVGCFYLVAKILLLTIALQGPLWFLYPFAGRGAIVMAASIADPVKREGLGSMVGKFGAKSVAWSIPTFTILLFGLCGTYLYLAGGSAWPQAFRISGIAMLVVTASMAAAGICSALIYKRKMGGMTGDGLGMACECGELAALLLLVCIPYSL